MRKYFIGFIIGLTLLIYSIVLRHQHSAPVIAPVATTQSSATPVTTITYKNGTYTGSVENAFYGDVQVSAVIQNGKITTVNFLQHPDENPNSIYVNNSAMPYLKQESIKAQSSNVSVVTGATFTSQAFMQSLANALSQAKKG